MSNVSRRIVIGTELVMAISAVGGGIGLIAGFAPPVSQLAPLGLTTWVVPALALIVVIGGSMFAAAVAMWVRRADAAAWSQLAAVALIGWLAVQVPFVGFSWLQPTCLAAAMLILAGAQVLRREG